MTEEFRHGEVSLHDSGYQLMAVLFNRHLQSSFALDQTTQRGERADGDELKGHQPGFGQGQFVYLRLNRFDRLCLHVEDHVGPVLAEPELLDLAVELDMALWLIRKTSPELATLVSRYLLADIRSSQAPYIIPIIWRWPIPSSCASSDGRGSVCRTASPCGKPPPRWRQALVSCNAVARKCSANHLYLTFRTFGSNEHKT
ncbi:hypothetical protein PH547_28010 [Rhizobium sp. CNPSo 3464]|uniref:hypothetical protein n=1 Tax=Rhizobium sp. CNPSo 3464 TaxID=3021406 RepID=UPI00254D4342|nr:hypothetical protein [Rhizobium sp. CNPSo 3464]MDK4742740.1 hypothetical protein [Rhizobium sp. CNPSo 3464]